MLDLQGLLRCLLQPSSRAEGEAALQSLLQEIFEADEGGDHERSYLLHRQVTLAWLVRQQAGPAPSLSRLEFLLLDSLGQALARRELFDRAKGAFLGARKLAAHQGDRFAMAWLDFRLGQVALDRLQPQRCEEILYRLLGFPLSWLHSGAIEAVRKMGWDAPGQLEQFEIQVEALRLMGRFWASQGRLDGAARSLRAALELTVMHPSRFASTPLLALELAELYLDRGEFRAVEQLREQWEIPWTVYHWDLLRADILGLTGHLSEAEQTLLTVCEAAQRARDAQRFKVRASALWQRAQLLANLNRMDEARFVLKELQRGGEVEPMAADQMLRYFEARRGGAEDGPPTVAELLRTTLPPRSSDRGQLSTLEPSLPPWRERAREWWGRLFQRVLLDLDQGEIEVGCQRLRAIPTSLMEALESPLLHAQHRFYGALVAFMKGELQGAEEFCRLAAESFATLEMRPFEWSAHRLCTLILDSERAEVEARGEIWSEEVQLVEVRGREENVLRDIRRLLSPVDRVFYMLNKQSSVEQIGAAVLRELRSAPEVDHRETTRLVSAAVNQLSEWHWNLREDVSLSRSEPLSSEGDVYTKTLDQFRFSRRRETSRIDVASIPQGAAVLWYVSLPHRLEAILFHHGRAQLLPLSKSGSGRKNLRDLVGRWVQLLEDSFEPWPKSDALPVGQRLSAILGLEDAARLLPESIRDLFIVVDDVLSQLPFAALPLEGEPLAARFALALLPRFRWSEPRSARDASELLGVAVPSSSTEPDLPDLPGVALDIEAIEGVRSLELLQSSEATKERVLMALGRAQSVHFACHGRFPPDRPHEAGLLLWDGWLTVRDLMSQLESFPEQVLTAACWAGGLDVLPGRELVGLPAVLLDLGARTVISPLWEVDDEENPALMNDLYSAMPSVGPMTALAATQRTWAKEGPASLWGGYVVYAEGVPRAELTDR